MLDENDTSFDEEEEKLQSEPNFDESGEVESDDKDKKTISADLIRGHINTIILRSLFDGDRYGYDIISEIEQKSHGQYSLKQPTLYSALKRLEAQGYVKAYWGGVSNGGRRRYFSLTDAGKAIVKQNQAEWEYSRTIIDNLISDEEFDFSQPVPQKLDFRILRQSTSRTPIVTDGEPAPQETTVTGETKPTTEIQPSIEPSLKEEPQTQPVQAEPVEPPLPLYSARSEAERNYKDIIGKIYENSIRQSHITQPQEPQPMEPPVAQPTEPIAPPSVDRTEPKKAQEPPTYERETAKAVEQPMESPSEPIKKIDFRDIKKQAETDGLRVWIAGSNTKKNSIPEDFFNKGFSLLKASLFFFAVAIVESLFVILFKNNLFTNSSLMIAYIAVMLSVTLAVPAVCAVLYLAKYAPCCRRLKKPIPLETGIVLFLVLFILLVAIDLLCGVKMTNIPLLFVSLIIPGVYLLNIILFAGMYYLFSKSKI